MAAAQSGDRDTDRVRKLFDCRHSGLRRNAAVHEVSSMPLVPLRPLDLH